MEERRANEPTEHAQAEILVCFLCLFPTICPHKDGLGGGGGEGREGCSHKFGITVVSIETSDSLIYN